jgi:hypothetical protein
VVFWWFFLWGLYCQPCLVQQQVVQRRNCVEEHRLHGRGEQLHQCRNTARFKDGEQALPMEFFLDINFKHKTREESFGSMLFTQSLLLADFKENHTVLYCGFNNPYKNKNPRNKITRVYS